MLNVYINILFIGKFNIPSDFTKINKNKKNEIESAIEVVKSKNVSIDPSKNVTIIHESDENDENKSNSNNSKSNSNSKSASENSKNSFSDSNSDFFASENNVKGTNYSVGNGEIEQIRLIKRQKKVVDSNPEEIDEEDDDTVLYQTHANSPLLLEYESKNKLYFDLLITLLIFVSVIYSPITLAFGQKITIGSMFFDIFTDTMFIVDMVLQFFVPYMNYDEIIVRDFGMIAENYFCSWFFLDLVASAPLSSVIDFMFILNPEGMTDDPSVNLSSISNTINFAKFYRMIKFTQMIRVFKITNEGKSQDKKIKKNNDKNKEISFMEDLNISSAYKRLLKFITAFI